MHVFILFVKAIVWDEYLTGPFGLIAQYSLLKVRECLHKNTHNGIFPFPVTVHHLNVFMSLPLICLFNKEHEVEKMFTLKGGRIPSAAVKNIVFFVRPRLELMDIIAENVARFNYINSHLYNIDIQNNLSFFLNSFNHVIVKQ